jgi:hypothetical protein
MNAIQQFAAFMEATSAAHLALPQEIAKQAREKLAVISSLKPELDPRSAEEFWRLNEIDAYKERGF